MSTYLGFLIPKIWKKVFLWKILLSTNPEILQCEILFLVKNFYFILVIVYSIYQKSTFSRDGKKWTWMQFIYVFSILNIHGWVNLAHFFAHVNFQMKFSKKKCKIPQLWKLEIQFSENKIVELQNFFLNFVKTRYLCICTNLPLTKWYDT